MKCALLMICWLLIPTRALCQGQHAALDKLSSRYYQIIPAPTAPDQWNAWRAELHHWKDSLLSSMKYTGSWYTRPEYTWASKAYSTIFLMANDRGLYDGEGHFAILNYLQRYEQECGGVDIVLLWPAYPLLGFDKRDQFFFYRNLPGGINALKKVSNELHTAGKKLLIAYNPWDAVARNNGKDDESELLSLVHDIGADGIFLDTITGVEGFFEKLRASDSTAIFQAEIATPPGRLNGIHQAWLEIGWSQAHRSLEFDEVPSLVRNRWLEQRHMIYRLSRWSHEQSAVFQNAWMNGCGVVIWENIFGTMNNLNPRDRSTLQSMLPVQRRYTSYFTQGTWEPLVPVSPENVYASLWTLGGNKLWTLINRQEQGTMAKLSDIQHPNGTRYFDLIAGEEVRTVVQNSTATIYFTMKPRAIGCIFAATQKDLTPDFYIFIGRQKRAYASASQAHTYELPAHKLTPVNSTKFYLPSGIPGGMKNVPVASDSVKMEFTFTKRECGFYPINGLVDQSYSQEVNVPGSGWASVKLTPFAMDETLVTNRQFEAFLDATHFQPVHPENFLREWVNGKPPPKKEDFPVTWISLEDARAYAVWAGKRLPTEAEWQWAAQNGMRKDPWPWGAQYDSAKCNHGQFAGASKIKRFAKGRTRTGLYDMAGNVWQLTESERNDGTNVYWILKGGSWYRGPKSVWYADQGPRPASFGAKYLSVWPGLDRCGTVGFRCAVDVR